MPCQFAVSSRRISIHALREEGDLRHQRPCILLQQISIHALREEGDAFGTRVPKPGVISIHALREEGDATFAAAVQDLEKFLSTPSARRATGLGLVEEQLRGISIHALREEGDQDIPLVPLIDDNFYPRPPRGERRAA